MVSDMDLKLIEKAYNEWMSGFSSRAEFRSQLLKALYIEVKGITVGCFLPLKNDISLNDDHIDQIEKYNNSTCLDKGGEKDAGIRSSRREVVCREYVPQLLNEVKRLRRIENNKLQERSGSILLNSKVISFLYTLIRDHLPIGTIEAIVRDSSVDKVQYTNGWLAKYCEDIAGRLK